MTQNFSVETLAQALHRIPPRDANILLIVAAQGVAEIEKKFGLDAHQAQFLVATAVEQVSGVLHCAPKDDAVLNAIRQNCAEVQRAVYALEDADSRSASARRLEVLRWAAIVFIVVLSLYSYLKTGRL